MGMVSIPTISLFIDCQCDDEKRIIDFLTANCILEHSQYQVYIYYFHFEEINQSVQYKLEAELQRQQFIITEAYLFSTARLGEMTEIQAQIVHNNEDLINLYQAHKEKVFTI